MLTPWATFGQFFGILFILKSDHTVVGRAEVSLVTRTTFILAFFDVVESCHGLWSTHRDFLTAHRDPLFALFLEGIFAIFVVFFTKSYYSKIGGNVIIKFWHRITNLLWNIALWLVKKKSFKLEHPIRVLYFSIALQCYNKICLWHKLMVKAGSISTVGFDE